MNLARASPNINIHHQIVLIRGLSPEIIARENILIVFVLPVFLLRRTAAKNIIPHLVIRFVRLLMRITVETEIVFRPHTVVPNIGRIALLNAKRLIMITVEIGRL